MKTAEGRKQRTPNQNNAMCLYERKLAKALNDAGYTVKKVLARKPKVDLPWTRELVHSIFWLTLLKVLEGKDSSKEMNTVDPDEIYKIIREHVLDISEGNIDIPWPSEESMMEEQR